MQNIHHRVLYSYKIWIQKLALSFSALSIEGNWMVSLTGSIRLKQTTCSEDTGSFLKDSREACSIVSDIVHCHDQCPHSIFMLNVLHPQSSCPHQLMPNEKEQWRKSSLIGGRHVDCIRIESISALKVTESTWPSPFSANSISLTEIWERID